MKDDLISLVDLTKDYGNQRGIFNVTLNVREGEMLGFVGTNGSGKTTTLRHIMGFLRPTSGNAYVNGLETWTHSSEIVKNIGYVPGEIAFPDLSTGTEFFKSQARFLGLKNLSYADDLISRLQLDPGANLKRMSKGMKQKTAIVAALMNDPSILILDEPTTGLDPLMRDTFLEIVKEEHAKGKTIIMSSHMFGEMEQTCDRVALIRNGRIIDIADMSEIRNTPRHEYKVEFQERKDYETLKKLNYTVVRDQPQYNQLTISVENGEVGKLFLDLKGKNVKFISEVKYTLERHFKEILEKEKQNNVQ